MSVSRRAPHAPGGLIIAVVLGLLLLALPATSHATEVPDPGSGWHGRAIHTPHHHTTTRTTTPTTSGLGTLAPGRGLTSPHGSQAVRALQRQLTQLGYRPGPIDGRYGPRTRDAITWFQTKHGLTQTGTATPTTRRHLTWRATTPQPQTTPNPNYVTTTPQPIPHAPVEATNPDPVAMSPTALHATLAVLVAAGLAVALASYRSTRTRLHERLTAATPERAASPPPPSSPPRSPLSLGRHGGRS
jgi:peptidoglycan hydrolase-like protein with peptidoglycan-binding domain